LRLIGRELRKITSGSGKLLALNDFLKRAAADQSPPTFLLPGEGASTKYKKHAVVFTSRPGIAVILHAYAELN
jgi:SNF2 family DNA or RNA helicase